MNVLFYNFQKRTNSTKQPGSGDSATTLSCELKDETSMINPTLIIQTITAGSAPAWNYVYIASFSRYYFITNWNWQNGVWSCDCVVDVLASFKTEIGNMSEYVLRSSSVHNGQIIDMQYPTTAETRVNATQLTNRFRSVLAGGYYVVGIISNDSNSAQGAITYYQMTPAEMAALKNYMLSDTFMTDQGLDIQTVVDVLPNELLKTLYNPFQYIASCVWLPFPDTDIPNNLKTSETIKFGWWTPTSATITGNRINSNGYVATVDERISIYGHPQRQYRGVFLDHSPFADRMLYYPPFGSIPINDDSIIGGDFIRVQLTVDMVFGDAVLTVFHDRPIGSDSYQDMGVIARVSAPLAVPIQLAQNDINVGGSISAIGVSAAGATASAFVGSAKDFFNSVMDNPMNAAGGIGGIIGNTFSASLKGTFSAIGDVVNSPVGQLQTSGTNGSLAQYSTLPYFVQKWRIVADDDNAQKGRPLCTVTQMSSIPGYIMVDTPDVSLACMEPERQTIIDFMSKGFYYE